MSVLPKLSYGFDKKSQKDFKEFNKHFLNLYGIAKAQD